MAARRILIAFDSLTDVVSAYLAGTRSAKVQPAPHDGRMLIEFDAAGDVVGVEIVGIGAMVPTRWQLHPDRHLIPRDLLSEIDRWLAHRWADLGRTG